MSLPALLTRYSKMAPDSKTFMGLSSAKQTHVQRPTSLPETGELMPLSHYVCTAEKLQPLLDQQAECYVPGPLGPTMAGILQFGLMAVNSGLNCSPFMMSIAWASYSKPNSSSAQATCRTSRPDHRSKWRFGSYEAGRCDSGCWVARQG